MKYYVGYYMNRYAYWHCVRSFDTPIELIHWLKINASLIDGAIDFLVEREG